MSKEEDMKIVTDAMNHLLDHFDSVQLFCTRHMPAELDGTVIIDKGGGNWYTRYGQINAWMIYQEQLFRESAKEKPE